MPTNFFREWIWVNHPAHWPVYCNKVVGAPPSSPQSTAVYIHGRSYPPCLLRAGFLFLIWIASTTFLCRVPVSLSMTCASSKLMACSGWLITCSPRADLVFFLRTESLCSLILVARGLMVSPTYSSSHVSHLMEYTTPHFSSVVRGSLGFTSACLSVLPGLECNLTLYLWKILPSLSVRS